ncbi:hypothetical protein ACHAXH_004783 [Discostella pseudostelligera]
MAMHLISPTDALFTLNSSLQHRQNDTQSIAKNTGKSTGAGVTGVCFVKDPASTLHDDSDTNTPVRNRRRRSDSDRDTSSNDDATDEESSDDDDVHPLQFRSSSLVLGPQHARKNDTCYVDNEAHQHATHLSAASYDSLSGALLASCHIDGSVKLWDLATRRCRMNDIFSECPRGAPGLAIRRLGIGSADGSNEFLYQTRDRLGTVTFHDLNRPSTPLLTLHTHSTTFCAISPCHIGAEPPVEGASIGGARHLVALPTEEHSVAIVRDLRCNPQDNPAWRVAVGDDYISSMYGTRRKYGMTTSLALCLQESTNNIVLGCGMENGSALFYDLGALGRGRDPWWIEPGKEAVNDHNIDPRFMCSTSLGNDPILCMDLVSSRSAEMCPEIMEDNSHYSSKTKAASLVAVGGFRSKTRTCSIDSGGKVGVSICQFRPDGRIFAVGGWDHRLRLFSRTSSKPLAILRGHDESVTAIDWASNAALSGLLATGAGDGRICLWREFQI